MSFSVEDDAVAADFNNWLLRHAPWRGPTVPPNATGDIGFLNDLTADEVRWGGFKGPACTVWGGALNWADLADVVDKFSQMPWLFPGAVQLMMMDQGQSYFRIWMIRNGKPVQVAPELENGDDDFS